MKGSFYRLPLLARRLLGGLAAAVLVRPAVLIVAWTAGYSSSAAFTTFFAAQILYTWLALLTIGLPFLASVKSSGPAAAASFLVCFCSFLGLGLLFSSGTLGEAGWIRAAADALSIAVTIGLTVHLAVKIGGDPKGTAAA